MPNADATANVDLLARTVPGCLREHAQWVCWKYVLRAGKQTKCPFNARTGRKADTTDPNTWSSFDEARQACRTDERHVGVGFVFAAADPFCGIDLDDCIDGTTGEIKTWGRRLIDQLDSYSEISPSGAGVKIFVQARKPGTRCKKALEDGAVEIYDRDRFCTVTACRVLGTPDAVCSRQEAVDELYKRVFGAAQPKQPTANPPAHALAMTDDEIVEKASRSRRSGEKFAALWAGNWKGHFGSQSKADSSLVFTIAFYTKDATQIDRLFRRSGLMRDKWDEKHGAQTYGEMTIARALTNVTSQYAPRNAAMRRRISTPARTEASLPEIITTDIQLRDLTAFAVDALSKSNDPPALFVRSGSLVRITEDENHVPKIETLERVHVRSRLSEVANFYVLKRSGDAVHQISVAPPLPLAENILVQGTWPFPPLAGLARSPIVRPDGTLCLAPGYDARTRLVYIPDPGLKLPRIPELPTLQEVRASVETLQRVVVEFPFADRASRANALSILFSVLLRTVIKGHVPLAIFDAPVQGTGKTLLVSVLVWIAVGSIASESVPSKLNEDEWRKKITSLLKAAAPVILLDNVPDNTAIDSSSLAAALTSHEWSDRLLGFNETIRVPSKAIWIATGNNLRVAGDMPRRSYTIRLDAQAERPWERSGFCIPDLEAYVRERRGELLAAALTIVRGWFAADCPRIVMRPFGSFDEWAGIVGSVMAFAGIGGFLDNVDQTRAVQDEDNRQWQTVVDAWWNRFGGRTVTVAKLFAAFFAEGAADPIDIPEVLLDQKDRGEGSLRRSLGKQLARLTGRIFDGRKLCNAGDDTHSKVRAWLLRPIQTGENEESNPANPALCGVSFCETPQPE